jgi:hypothetical protein
MKPNAGGGGYSDKHSQQIKYKASMLNGDVQQII